MRFPLLIVFSCLWRTCAAEYFDDPCWFVGLYIAKIPSHCLANVCSRINMMAELNFVCPVVFTADSIAAYRRISCQEASVIRERVIQSIPVSENIDVPKKRPRRAIAAMPFRVKQVIDLLNETIIPAAKRLIFMDIPLDSYALEPMRAVHDMLVVLSKEGGEWVSYRSMIVGSQVFSDFSQLTRQALYTSGSRAVSDSPNQLSELLHFLGDMAAFLGSRYHIMDPSSENRVLHLAPLIRPVTYRPASAVELSSTSLAQLRGIEPDQLGLARSIDHLCLLADNAVSRLSIHSMAHLTSLALRLPENIFGLLEGSSASDALVGFQLQNDLCPKLDKLMMLPPMKDVWRQVSLALMAFCSTGMYLSKRMGASLELAKRVDLVLRPPSIALSRIDEGVAMLFAPGIDWSHELSGDPERYTDKIEYVFRRFNELYEPLVSSGGAIIFKPASAFGTRAEFESTSIALGRLIGLSVRYGVDMSITFNIEPYLIRVLHTPRDTEIDELSRFLPSQQRSSTDSLTRALLDKFFEPVFFIRMGFDDVIGPSGMSIMQPDDWYEYFRNLPVDLFPVSD